VGLVRLLTWDFDWAGIAAAEVGPVDDTLTMRISDGDREKEVFDFKKEGITGIRDTIEL
jgi:selenophosphate synthetase-related protein